MALSPRSEAELKKRNYDKIKLAKDPVDKLRLTCLSRGANGIKGLGRSFRIVDTDSNRQLSYSEFEIGLSRYGLLLPKEEVQQLFSMLDKDNSGTVDYDEFLERLRPPMSDHRKKMVGMAFVKLDTTGDGFITSEDLKRVYNVRHHPKYQNGEWSEHRCLNEFLHTFEEGGNKDGTVTKDEFLNYYSAVSSSIEQDPYFDLMMRNTYQLKD